LSAEAPAPAPAEVASVAEPAPTRRACVVLLGGRPFAVDVTEAREVVALDATTPVPGAPAAVLGLMNLRGGVLPVVEARPLLGLPVRPATGPGRALVLADGERRAAIVIERVLGLTAFHEVAAAEAPDPVGLIAGALDSETGDRAALLDARVLLETLRRAWEPA
jgi:purine-binding chemotaxis protein CheW